MGCFTFKGSIKQYYCTAVRPHVCFVVDRKVIYRKRYVKGCFKFCTNKRRKTLFANSGNFHRHARRLLGKTVKKKVLLLIFVFFWKTVGRDQEFRTSYVAVRDFTPCFVVFDTRHCSNITTMFVGHCNEAVISRVRLG